MKRYPEHKDSGVEWIGEIPQEWNIRKLKYLSDIRTGDKDTIDRDDNGRYPFFVRAQKIEKIGSYSYDGEAVLTAGDGVGVGKVFHYVNGKFDFHQRVYKISDFMGIDGKYLFYYMKEYFHKEVMKLSAKSTVDSLRLPMFQNFPVTFGDIKEQRNIAKYLDYKVHLIDTLIAKKTKQIELLQEQRTAIINHAVTKGFSPNVKMKYSGNDFLGDVPEHWTLCLIKRKVITITDGAHVSPETENGIYPFVSVRDLKNGEIDFANCLLTSKESYEYLSKNGCKPRKHDLLFSKDGTIGNTALVRQNDEFVVASSLIIIRPDVKSVYPKYLEYLCQSEFFLGQIHSFVKGAALKRVSIQNITRVIGIFPPIEEQIDIANKISDKVVKIESMIKCIEKVIDKLYEFRTALISEVVTGKIDVRDEAIP